ncbi:MAG: amidohydrolase [Planctomycetaceae bacterium]
MNQSRGRLWTKNEQRVLAGWDAQIDQRVSRIEGQLSALRRHLHAHPEPSGAERRTSRFLAAELERVNIPARLGDDDLGVIADLDVGTVHDDSPVIALRADIDALRIADAKRVPYMSREPGLAHACGHDAHATLMLGTALVGAQFRHGSEDDPSVRLRLIFQPAEETSQGARWLVDQGAMDGVAYILGVHVEPALDAGHVGIRYGTLTANCDEVEILVTGQGGHAARPFHTIDPIAAAVQLVSALYAQLPRSVDARNPTVFSIGRFAGGSVANVIPDQVELNGCLRTTDVATRDQLRKQIRSVCAGLEASTGTRMTLRFFNELNSVENDPHITAILEDACHRCLEPDKITRLDQPSMGGEDFSVYQQRAPGAMLRLGSTPPGRAPTFLHAPDFDIDERILPMGVRIFLRTALALALPSARGQSGDQDA